MKIRAWWFIAAFVLVYAVATGQVGPPTGGGTTGDTTTGSTTIGATSSTSATTGSPPPLEVIDSYDQLQLLDLNAQFIAVGNYQLITIVVLLICILFCQIMQTVRMYFK